MGSEFDAPFVLVEELRVAVETEEPSTMSVVVLDSPVVVDACVCVSVASLAVVVVAACSVSVVGEGVSVVEGVWLSDVVSASAVVVASAVGVEVVSGAEVVATTPSLEARLTALVSASWMSSSGMGWLMAVQPTCMGLRKSASTLPRLSGHLFDMHCMTVSSRLPFAARHMHDGRFVPHPEPPTQSLAQSEKLKVVSCAAAIENAPANRMTL